MRPRIFLFAAALVVVFPAALAAQTIGFRVGIASPQPGGFTPFGVAGRAHAGVHPPGFPFGGVHPGFGGGLHRGGHVRPGLGYPSWGGVINTGTVIVIGPGQVIGPGHKVAPGFRKPGRNRGVQQPVVIIGSGRAHTVTPTHPTAPGGNPTRAVPTSPVVAPERDGIFISGASRRVVQPATAAVGAVGVGSTRAEVIAEMGRPTVAMADRNGEALVFGDQTFLIQNGVVTKVDGR